MEYYENCTIKNEGEYDGYGNKDGFWTTYYENGYPESHGEYIEHLRIGKWVFFYEDGTKQAEGEYSMEVKSGRLE